LVFEHFGQQGADIPVDLLSASAGSQRGRTQYFTVSIAAPRIKPFDAYMVYGISGLFSF
jgi:hypothetical protein